VFAELLRRKLAGIVDLSESQIGALEAHYSLMLRWNAKVNLTTITGVEEAVERHYCESLFLGAHLPAGALRIVDVGSGAGFPGFPVAVLRPDCDVTLIESHQRKGVFLSESARRFSNIKVVAKRAEQIQERFDHVISRAVSYDDLTKLLKVLAPNADLLTGAEVPPIELGFQWREAVPLPWGEHRFLRMGTT